MALGADRTDVLRLVVREGMRLTLIGIVVGLLVSLGLGAVLSRVLYGAAADEHRRARGGHRAAARRVGARVLSAGATCDARRSVDCAPRGVRDRSRTASKSGALSDLLQGPIWQRVAGRSPPSGTRPRRLRPGWRSSRGPRSRSTPLFTRSPLTQTVIDRPRASMTIVFHCPSGFSDPSVRFRIRRASPSAPPHFSPAFRGRRVLHVGHLDVLLDAPEVAGVAAVHLHFDRLRKHLVERAQARRVDEDAAVARLAGKAVLGFEPVIAIRLLRQQVPLGLAEADEHAVTDDEAGRRVRVGIPRRHVRLPVRQILAVEQRHDAVRRDRWIDRRRKPSEQEEYPGSVHGRSLAQGYGAPDSAARLPHIVQAIRRVEAGFDQWETSLYERRFSRYRPGTNAGGHPSSCRSSGASSTCSRRPSSSCRCSSHSAPRTGVHPVCDRDCTEPA